MLRLGKISYAMTRFFIAVHQAQHATSEHARVRAAAWAGAWNLFIQEGIRQLRLLGGNQVPAFPALH